MYQKEISEIMAEVQSSPEGLTQQEAAKRLENGLNQLKEAPKKSSFALFLDTFLSFLLLLSFIRPSINYDCFFNNFFY